MSFPIRVADVMSRPLQTINAEATAAAAAAECTERDIGSLVVVENETPVGIITNTDLVQLLGSATNPQTQPLCEFMSSPVVTIESDAPVGAAVDKIVEYRISRLVAVEAGEHVGLVSTDDIVHYVPQVLHRHQLPSSPHEEHHYTVRPETAYEKSDWEFECACRSDTSVSVGDRVTFTKSISEQDVQAFAEASGDTNRLHLDAEFATQTRFRRRIVHGTLVGGLISAALARLPGLTIYISQDLSFLSPADIGERVTAVCTVVESLGRHKYELTTDVFTEDGEQVIEGEAAVLIDESQAVDQSEFQAIP